jgi:hypothetical protein
MAAPPKDPLRAVTADEEAAMERRTKASSARVDRVRRATALLAVARGASHRQAARQAGFRSPRAVAGRVPRFKQPGLTALEIAAGRGRKATDAPAARARIVATAQRPAERKPTARPPGRCAASRASPTWGRRPSAGCCPRPAVPPNAPALGARPAPPSANARAGW